MAPGFIVVIIVVKGVVFRGAIGDKRIHVDVQRAGKLAGGEDAGVDVEVGIVAVGVDGVGAIDKAPVVGRIGVDESVLEGDTWEYLLEDGGGSFDDASAEAVAHELDLLVVSVGDHAGEVLTLELGIDFVGRGWGKICETWSGGTLGPVEAPEVVLSGVCPERGSKAILHAGIVPCVGAGEPPIDRGGGPAMDGNDEVGPIVVQSFGSDRGVVDIGGREGRRGRRGRRRATAQARSRAMSVRAKLFGLISGLSLTGVSSASFKTAGDGLIFLLSLEQKCAGSPLGTGFELVLLIDCLILSLALCICQAFARTCDEAGRGLAYRPRRAHDWPAYGLGPFHRPQCRNDVWSPVLYLVAYICVRD